MAVDLITAALAAGAAGAGAGLKDTVAVAVRDAYTSPKELLGARLGSRPDAAKALETDETEPGVWQTRIGDALSESGSTDDEQVLAAARRLLALADPDKARAFNINVGTNNGAIGEFTAPVTFHQGPPVPPASPGAP